MDNEIGVDPDLDNRGTAKSPGKNEVYLVNGRKVGRIFLGRDDPLEPGHKRRMTRKKAESCVETFKHSRIEECPKSPASE